MPVRMSSPAAALAGRLLRVRWIVRAPVWLYRARLGLLFEALTAYARAHPGA